MTCLGWKVPKLSVCPHRPQLEKQKGQAHTCPCEQVVSAEMWPLGRSAGSPVRLVSRDRDGRKMMSQIQGPWAEFITTRCALAP